MKKIPDKSHSSSMVSGTEMSLRPHPEKVSRAPIPGGNGEYHTGNEVIGQVPTGTKEDQRVPSNPTAGPVPNSKKAATQGFADHKRARGRAYEYSEVDTSNHAKDRTELVPVDKRAGAGDDRRYISNTSSFGGKPWKQ